ncbi:MAG: hypothetical protein A2V74_04025 [Acidobacteria bacterium RBG_16_70_10]|nr:MAG: hypothetical protein A2V74_04025 [Acidobacteria bacterium RBG_16_70_10]
MTDSTPSWDFTTPVVFLGAWFAGYEDGRFDMELFLGGSLVHSVVIQDLGPNHWVLDDLTYEPVPEPGNLVLLGAGLIGLTRLRRRV